MEARANTATATGGQPRNPPAGRAKSSEYLKTPCLAALAQDGEITKADEVQHAAPQTKAAKASNPQSAKKAPDIKMSGFECGQACSL